MFSDLQSKSLAWWACYNVKKEHDQGKEKKTQLSNTPSIGIWKMNTGCVREERREEMGPGFLSSDLLPACFYQAYKVHIIGLFIQFWSHLSANPKCLRRNEVTHGHQLAANGLLKPFLSIPICSASQGTGLAPKVFILTAITLEPQKALTMPRSLERWQAMGLISFGCATGSLMLFHHLCCIINIVPVGLELLGILLSIPLGINTLLDSVSTAFASWQGSRRIYLQSQNGHWNGFQALRKYVLSQHIFLGEVIHSNYHQQAELLSCFRWCQKVRLSGKLLSAPLVLHPTTKSIWFWLLFSR